MPWGFLISMLVLAVVAGMAWPTLQARLQKAEDERRAEKQRCEQLEREHAARTEQKAIEAAKPKVEKLEFSVAGVTFKDGRLSRQTQLKRFYFRDPPFHEQNAELTLREEEYEGNPAFSIFLNDRKIGYVPKEHAQYLHDNYDRILGLSDFQVKCAKDRDDDEVYIYYAKAAITLSLDGSKHDENNPIEIAHPF
ncbi:MAG: hypothetical protein RR224_12205 [Clostridia bacterium]